MGGQTISLLQHAFCSPGHTPEQISFMVFTDLLSALTCDTQGKHSPWVRLKDSPTSGPKPQWPAWCQYPKHEHVNTHVR